MRRSTNIMTTRRIRPLVVCINEPEEYTGPPSPPEEVGYVYVSFLAAFSVVGAVP
jgi:hypothetical protein